MNEVAIIIPTMDNRHYLEPCLKSLRENTTRATYRVYVVNNGGMHSCDWINDSRVTVLQAYANIGWERGLQHGLDCSTLPLVLFLNDDTLFLRTKSDWLAHLVADLDDPNVAAAGPSSNLVAGPQSTTQQLTAPRYQARYLIGFCLLVRRSALDAVGGIDPTLPGGDDIDLSIRLRRTSYTLVCDRRSFVYHYGFRTGHRVHGGPDQPWGWNSPAMVGKTALALRAKHGDAVFDEARRNDPLDEYIKPPFQDSPWPPGGKFLTPAGG
jgi:GT2 family glycosyltransferase